MQMIDNSRTTTRSPARSASSVPRDLPRLPVPNLHQTLERYLTSLEPFLKEDESLGGASYEESYNLRVKWAKDFESGIGKACQERLLALDKTSPSNWLDDTIWMRKAYHEWRAPLLVNSNWWLAFNNDPSVPDSVIRGHGIVRRSGTTDWQVRRAAWLVHRVLDWKIRSERDELSNDITRAGLWLRHTTAKMFNISRIPQALCDALSLPPHPTDTDARNILVLVHDWFYAIEVLDSNLRPSSVADIERRLTDVVEDVELRLAAGEQAPPVGILSADQRDLWSRNMHHLLSLSDKNHATLRAINHSIFALSLDHYVYALPPSPSVDGPSDSPLPSPCTIPELTAHLHNVRSGPAQRPAHNRWYDKPFSLIVEQNTRAGALGEHSPCDALVPSIVAEYAIVQGIDEKAFGAHADSKRSASSVPGWQRLDWVVDRHIENECLAAEERARVIVADSDDGILWFDDYGAEWIKNIARFSPDAYIQMALQLAWHRTRGCFTATYETALTRIFKNGRTETIRTLTSNGRAFVLAMRDPCSSVQVRQSLLRRAIQTHMNLTRHATTGRGIDRHLLGLRLMLRAEEGERHELFDDELFIRSQTWKLSTSGLSAGSQFRGTGFGASYSDGYGINCAGVIKFGIESKMSSPWTSTEKFKLAIVEALHDMKIISEFTVASHL